MASYQFNQNTAGVQTIQVTGSPVLFRNAVVYAYKGFSNDTPINNSSGVFFGKPSGSQYVSLTTGTNTSLSQRDDLSNYWFKATSGDGLFIVTY